MNLESIFLRALEPRDLDVLFEIENENEFWKYSNRTEPFSKNVLRNYIEQQHQDIFEVTQIILRHQNFLFLLHLQVLGMVEQKILRHLSTFLEEQKILYF